MEKECMSGGAIQDSEDAWRVPQDTVV
jgi:hypothetical protein